MSEKARKTANKIFLYILSFIFLAIFSLISGISLLWTFLLISLFAYFKIAEHKRPFKVNLLYLGFLLIISITLAVLFKRYTDLSPYFIPIPFTTMLAVILFPNLEIALLLALVLSGFVGFIFHTDLHLMVVIFIGSITGALFVYGIRQRYKIIQAGVWVSLVMLLSLSVISFRSDVGILSFLSPLIAPAFVNGILSAFLVAGGLPIFEFLFRTATNISLLELSDFNHPLLKRLVLEAPGTYHHSLLVGNLSEVAAEAVNANALLARVGAYYHDVGKLENPEYFSENQLKTASRHEQLKASISKLVIINHVKEGLVLAKKYKLNQAIADFIEQHHGTSLVFYFYRRAIIEETKKKENVKEDVFRYAGPKPQTREIAIVLLADSVEAACRAQEDPNAGKIEDVVQTVINNKFIDGQLDECDLTLKDLNKISKTFIHILSAVYHNRIEYPEITSESNSKESSKKNQD